MTSPNTIRIRELDIELIPPSTKTMWDAKQGGAKTVVIGKPGCFSKGTKVLMFSGGIKNVEDIKIGEQVMGDDSTPRNVLDICRNVEMMYDIIPTNGDPIQVNENHILSLKSTDYNNSIIDITVKDFLQKSETFQKRYKWYRTSVNFEEKPIKFDPYVLGLWLGTNSDITTTDKEIFNNLSTYYSKEGYDFFIKNRQENRLNVSMIRSKEFKSFLRNSNLLHNKHIPQNYKVNSEKNRLELLAGVLDTVLDTDSIYDKGCFDIIQKNELLLDDILYLARSLGFSAYKKKCYKSCTKNSLIPHIGTYYMCTISGDIDKIPTKILRKQELPKKQIKNVLVTDFNIEQYKVDNYFGFELDNNHRFLLSDFSVVHNSGKCHSPGTLLIMYDGTVKKVEDIKVRELLMGDDSTPRTVLSTCEGEDEMYEIIQFKGENYTVNAPHILSLRKINTQEIIDIPLNEFIKNNSLFKRNHKGFKVDVEFPEQKVSLDPYLFGFWLGDNSINNNVIENDEDFLKYFNEISNKLFNEENYQIFKTKYENYKIVDFFKSHSLLRENRHIPNLYKINNRKCRLQLLAGLLDSNAYYDTKYSFDFIHSSEQLVKDVVFLSRSLGFSAYKRECQNTIKDNTLTTLYRCRISGNVNHIPFKIFKPSLYPIPDCTRSDIRIKHIGRGKYHGFQLDGNHRYLLGDFTVTHNTTLITDLLYKKKHIFPVGMAISGSEDSNHHYREIFPSTVVHNEYTEDKAIKFVRRQKIAKEHLENPWAVLLLDDCTDDRKIFNKPIQQALYKKGRHYKMWYILSLQYAMDVKPSIRVNIDGTFILREPSIKIRKVIWENYAGIIPDFGMFCDIMDQITDNYTALYIHNATTSNNLTDCIFYYKADQTPRDFKFGCPEMWMFHYDRYNTDYTEPLI
jgi:hypothetical protein